MKMLQYLAVACLLFALAPANQASAQAENQRIDPEAESVIRRMSNFLAEQQTFTFDAEVLYETVYGGFDQSLDTPAEKITSTRRVSATARRPDAFFVSIEQDPQALEFYFNGTTLVLHDNAAKAYVKKQFTGSTDDALALLRNSYDSDPPLSDLLESNLYDTHMKDVTYASYVGETRLRGQEVHHVAFASEGMDWQIWVTKGSEPVPVLLQIVARNQAFWPYFQAWFTGWEFGMDVADEVFLFEEPKDSLETQFVEDGDFAN